MSKIIAKSATKENQYKTDSYIAAVIDGIQLVLFHATRNPPSDELYDRSIRLDTDLFEARRQCPDVLNEALLVDIDEANSVIRQSCQITEGQYHILQGTQRELRRRDRSRFINETSGTIGDPSRVQNVVRHPASGKVLPQYDKQQDFDVDQWIYNKKLVEKLTWPDVLSQFAQVGQKNDWPVITTDKRLLGRLRRYCDAMQIDFKACDPGNPNLKRKQISRDLPMENTNRE